MKRQTLLYIMGYGRSGSTILDILLQQHPGIVGLGALGELFDWIVHDRSCACGQRIAQCPFWRPVIEQVGIADVGAARACLLVQRNVESRRRFPLLAGGTISPSSVTQYRHQLNKIIDAVFVESGAQVAVDSSKSGAHYAGRAVALQRYAAVEVKVVHLVRDGRGVVWSAMKGPGSPERTSAALRPVRFARAASGWTMANMYALMSKRYLRRESVLRVEYEDLCVRPAEVLGDIGKLIDLDLEPIARAVEGGEEFTSGHNLGGNQVRFQERLTFRPDERWRTELPWAYRALFAGTAGIVAKRLGYARPYIKRRGLHGESES